MGRLAGNTLNQEVSPLLWNFQPRLADPNWLWYWEHVVREYDCVAAFPMIEKGGSRIYNYMPNMTDEQITIELLYYPTSTNVTAFVAKPTQNGAHSSPFFDWSLLSFGTDNLRFFAGTAGAQTTVGGFLTQRWHHVVCSYDGSDVRYFHDGRLAQTVSHSATIVNANSADVRIGGNGLGQETGDRLTALVVLYSEAIVDESLTARLAADPFGRFRLGRRRRATTAVSQQAVPSAESLITVRKQT
jgi:hypothetical protein